MRVGKSKLLEFSYLFNFVYWLFSIFVYVCQFFDSFSFPANTCVTWKKTELIQNDSHVYCQFM